MRICENVFNLKDYIESFDPDNYMACLKLKKDLVSAAEKITEYDIVALSIVVDDRSDRMSLVFTVNDEDGNEYVDFVNNNSYSFKLDSDEVEYILDNIFA